MFSEALKIADRNTVKYMIEELQDKATHEAELRKQTEVKLQLSRENEQKLQEKIAELQSLLSEKN